MFSKKIGSFSSYFLIAFYEIYDPKIALKAIGNENYNSLNKNQFKKFIFFLVVCQLNFNSPSGSDCPVNFSKTSKVLKTLFSQYNGK